MKPTGPKHDAVALPEHRFFDYSHRNLVFPRWTGSTFRSHADEAQGQNGFGHELLCFGRSLERRDARPLWQLTQVEHSHVGLTRLGDTSGKAQGGLT
jgi:hypothetical protein